MSHRGWPHPHIRPQLRGSTGAGPHPGWGLWGDAGPGAGRGHGGQGGGRGRVRRHLHCLRNRGQCPHVLGVKVILAASEMIMIQLKYRSISPVTRPSTQDAFGTNFTTQHSLNNSDENREADNEDEHDSTEAALRRHQAGIMMRWEDRDTQNMRHVDILGTWFWSHRRCWPCTPARRRWTRGTP